MRHWRPSRGCRQRGGSMSGDLIDIAVQAPIVGVSPSIQQALATARRFAPTMIPILLTGETGTGKELFAQAIHLWSGRCGPLVDVDCGALPRDLLEGELFGHKRGAFTGAATDTIGLIAHSDRGTLFLDELSSLPVEGQVKLLRALDTREVRRVGDTAKRRIDFRLVSAVQQGLARDVAEGRFRIDLFQRLAGAVIHLPPLAERMEDVEPLALYFLHQSSRMLAPGASALLRQYSWPGNVRELKAVVERAVILSNGPVVDPGALAEAIDLGSPEMRVMETRERQERADLIEAAYRNGGDRHRLARELGVSVATLYRKLRAHRISLIGAAGHSHQYVENGENSSTPVPIAVKPSGEPPGTISDH
jgi:transcriptional regulator with PAS, ATPase and Fis domain